jgi:hypothetical protein
MGAKVDGAASAAGLIRYGSPLVFTISDVDINGDYIRKSPLYHVCCRIDPLNKLIGQNVLTLIEGEV